MTTPIDKLKRKYGSAVEHLEAITSAIMEQFNIPVTSRAQVRKAVDEAWDVGRRTMTTDDWCDSW